MYLVRVTQNRGGGLYRCNKLVNTPGNQVSYSEADFDQVDLCLKGIVTLATYRTLPKKASA